MAFLNRAFSNKAAMRMVNLFHERSICLLAIFCFLFSCAQETRGQTAKDYDLKAVFLFNFAQFVDWPSEAFTDARSPIVIGVFGEDPIEKSLNEVVRNEVVRDRKLIVKRYNRVEEIETGHILYVSPSKAEQIDNILASLKGKSVLTVGETDKFTTRGGMIRFLTDQNRIRLRINAGAAKAAMLTISSKLLKAAEEITETTPSK